MKSPKQLGFGRMKKKTDHLVKVKLLYDTLFQLTKEIIE